MRTDSISSGRNGSARIRAKTAQQRIVQLKGTT